MKIFNRVKNAIKDIFKQLNIYIDSIKLSDEKCKTITMAGVVTGMIFCCVIVSVFFTTGYEVYLGSERIAVVRSKSDFESRFEDANEKIVEIAGKGYGINKIPKYIFTVSAKANISDDDEIMKNIMAQSPVIDEVYYINVDGENVACACSEKQAKAFIGKAAETYGGTEPKILNQIDIVMKYEKTKYFPSEDNSVKDLVSVLKIQTENQEKFFADVAYDTAVKQMDNHYVNEKKTVSEGKTGIMEVTAKVTKINGIATGVDIVSYSVVKEPVKEIVMVGTVPLPDVGTGEFIQPYYGVISSRFGTGRETYHSGVDIIGKTGEAIKAADNGVVAVAEYQNNGYGNIIIIDHNNGFVTYYAHLDSIGVQVGDIVEKGEVIGGLGNTGRSTGPHLHFEVRKEGKPINPEKYLEEVE